MNKLPDWKDRVRAVAAAAEPIERRNPLWATVEEFVAALNESPWIRAELRTDAVPQMRSLIVWPKYRRDISASMLTFWLGDHTITITGREGREFDSADALGQYLAEFVEKTQFPTTVATFRQMQNEPVHGTLRARGPLDNDPADVPVLVDAASHNRLAARALEDQADVPLYIDAALEGEHPAMGKFDEGTSYAYLESAGFGLRVRGAQRLSERMIRVRGDVVPLKELPR
jgi:hypothetical protein